MGKDDEKETDKDSWEAAISRKGAAEILDVLKKD